MSVFSASGKILSLVEILPEVRGITKKALFDTKQIICKGCHNKPNKPCKFLHKDGVVAAVDAPVKEECKSGTSCPHFPTGKCKFRHDEATTLVCRFDKTCAKYHLGTCGFLHNDAHVVDVAPVVDADVPCRSGAKCRYLEKGTCKFQH